MWSRRFPVWSLALLLLLLQAWGAALAQAPDRAVRPSPSEQEQIVVTGSRPIGAAIGNPTPERQLSPADIAAYGADNLSELIAALSLETQGSGGRGGIALVLLNGRRTFSFSEIGDIPPEAVLRLDILAEDVARRYGYPVGAKVLNVVLRPNYSTRIAELAHSRASAGGRDSPEGSLTMARNGPSGRLNLNVTAAHSDALLESERRVVGGFGAFRSLLPELDRFTITGTMARDRPSGIGYAATGRLELRRTVDLTGPSLPPSASGRPLRRERRDMTARLDTSAHGQSSGWQWTLAAQGQYAASDLRGERAGSLPYVADSERTELSLDGLANRTIARLPAGEVGLNLRAALDETTLRSRSTLSPGPKLERSRFRALASAGLDLPLSSRDQGNRGVGELTLGLSADAVLDNLKRALFRLESSLNWAPVRPLSIDLRYSIEEEAPTLEDLANPVTLLENVPVFDYVRGETAYVRLRTGGTASLGPATRRTIRAAILLRPVTGLNLSAIYTRTRTANLVGPYPAITRELELAFPGLFRRDAAGRLIEVDQSSVNFSRSAQDQLRWGLNWNWTLVRGGAVRVEESASAREAASALDQNARLNLSLFHTLWLRDRLSVRDGLTRLDFLNGSVAGLGGGRARHQVELQGTAALGGLGAQISGSWLSGSRVRAASGETLRFSPAARFDLRVFADLGHLMPRRSWASGTRLSLEFGNLFDSRIHVRGAAGTTPNGLQPAYLDPLGRTVRFSLRRVF